MTYKFKNVLLKNLNTNFQLYNLWTKVKIGRLSAFIEGVTFKRCPPASTIGGHQLPPMVNIIDGNW